MRELERSVLLAGVLLIAANEASAQGRRRPIATFPGLSQQVALDTAGTVRNTALPAGVVFGRLRTIYGKMKVPLGVDDSVGGMLGTLRQVQRQSLGGTQLAMFLNCGGDVSGPLANNGKVTLALVSTVSRAGDSTAVRTALVAAAQSVEGALRDAVSCTTTGRLEERIFNQATKP